MVIKMNYLVFDIGGTSVKYAVIDNSLNFLLKNSFPTNAHLGAISILKEIAKKVKQLSSYQPKGLALTSGGAINSQTGLVLGASENIPSYIGINVIDFFQKEFNLPTTILNDVNAVGLAESKLGAGKNFNNLLILALGTGIGGALIINNKLYEGNYFGAAEFGKMIIEGNDWEATTSTKALVSIIKTQRKVNNGLDVFKLYDEKDPFVKAEVDKFYYRLALGIINLTYSFGPDIVIIGGAISNRKTFLKELKEILIPLLPPFYQNNFKIDIAQYKNDAGMLGALIHHLNNK